MTPLTPTEYEVGQLTRRRHAVAALHDALTDALGDPDGSVRVHATIWRRKLGEYDALLAAREREMQGLRSWH